MPSQFIWLNAILLALSALWSLQIQAQDRGEEHVEVIVLDAGHGGMDPGAVYKGIQEKKITLAIIRALGAIIEEEMPGVKVIYTRSDDTFIPLHGRAQRANEENADLFLSVHCNYFHKNKAKHGSETYVMGLHKIEDNLSVVKRENAVVRYEANAGEHYDFDVNTPAGHIFLSMYQNASLDRSIRLADHIENALSAQLENKTRGVKQAGFFVLYRTSMPSVLVETGFLTNDRDRKILTTREGQHKIARSLFDAIVRYKSEVEGRSPSAFLSPSKSVASKGAVIYRRVSPPTAPDARMYTVQIAATTHSRKDLLRSIPDCREVKTGKYFKYKVGRYRDFESAAKCRAAMINKGYKGAFIVAE